MNKTQTRVLSCGSRVRDFVVEHDVNSDLAELTGAWREHHETLGQLTADAAAPRAITTQSCGQTTDVKRLRRALRESQLESIGWTTRSMRLEISVDDIAFLLPAFGVNDESLSTVGDAMATVLTVLGLQFIAQGLASNFLELLRNATRVRRDAIDQRTWRRRDRDSDFARGSLPYI